MFKQYFFLLIFFSFCVSSHLFGEENIKIENAGFEKGDLSGWRTRSCQKEFFLITDRGAYEGKYCLEVHGKESFRGNSFITLVQEIKIEPNPNSYYTIGGWAKASISPNSTTGRNSKTIGIAIRQVNERGKTISYAMAKTLLQQKKWAWFSHQFAVAKGATKFQVYLIAKNLTFKDRAWFDKITFKSDKQSQTKLFVPTKGIVIQPAFSSKNKNVVINGTVETGKMGWRGSSHGTDNFVFKIDNHVSRSGKNSLYIKSKGPKYSGYWRQAIKVKSGKEYLVNVWVKNKNARVLVLITGKGKKNRRFDKRITLEGGVQMHLIPVFLKAEYTSGKAIGNEWQLLSRSIKIPKGVKIINFAIGSYFGDGEMWFDDISLTEGMLPLRVFIKPEGNKTIKSIYFYMQGTGDVIFKKKFEKGIKEFNEVIPGTRANEACRLRVEYSDGTQTNSAYPSEKQMYLN